MPTIQLASTEGQDKHGQEQLLAPCKNTWHAVFSHLSTFLKPNWLLKEMAHVKTRHTECHRDHVTGNISQGALAFFP